jgi:hypothetical protein
MNSKIRNCAVPLLLNLFLIQAPQAQTTYTSETSLVPEVGVSADAYVGDRIFERMVGTMRECLVPTFSFEKHYLTVEAGKPMCLGSPDDDEYVPSYANDNTRYDGAPGKRNLLLKEKSGKYTLKFEKTRLSIKGLSEEEIGKKQVFFPQGRDGHKFVSYLGMSDSMAKFQYGEVDESGLERNKFDSFLDINESKTIVMKGLVIEIDEINTTKISYRIIRDFKL